MRHWKRRLQILLTMAMLAATLVVITAPAQARHADGPSRNTTELQFLSISDWHGQVDPLFVFGQGLFGGAAELSTYFQQERANNPNTLTLTAGDAFGASPPLSSFFDEVPAVETMNLMGFDVDGLGNHNFDKGIDHLQQMIDIADFPYVSANLKNVDDNLDGVEPYRMFNMGGVRVAVIGITNPDAPTLVFPGSFGTIEITDPVMAVKRAQRDAKNRGAQVFIVIAHMGVTSFDANGNPVGPIVDLANGVKGIDAIFGDHTGVAFSGEVNGIPIIENQSKGRTYARVTMTVERQRSYRGTRVSVEDVTVEFVDPVSGDVTPDPAIVAYLDPLRAELDTLLSQVVGTSNVFIPRTDSCGTDNGRTCESLVGDVVTDAMRTTYGTDFAFTNSGGLRANLTCSEVDDPSDFCPAQDGAPFDITAGQVLTVLPFGNVVVTVNLTGDEVKAHLENGVSTMPDVSGRFAQVSGLCVSYDIDAAAGSRVTGAVFQAEDGTCTGDAVDLTAGSTYSVALNDFMASGGDGYPVTIDKATTRDFMDAVVSDYIANLGTIDPSIEGRIICTGTTCPVLVP
jgi:2',3'-cyclic-nucleotide 2'-phosphodiesterase (5'-nucleotidase family)